MGVLWRRCNTSTTFYRDTESFEKWAWLTLGEWITSLLFGITSGYIYMVSYYQYLLYFSFFHFAIFAVTIVPIKGMLMSDGMQFLILIKDDERARNHLYEIQISSELFSYKRPKDWDERLVELSEEKIKENKGIREIMSRLMLVFLLVQIKREWKERYRI